MRPRVGGFGSSVQRDFGQYNHTGPRGSAAPPGAGRCSAWSSGSYPSPLDNLAQTTHGSPEPASANERGRLPIAGLASDARRGSHDHYQPTLRVGALQGRATDANEVARHAKELNSLGSRAGHEPVHKPPTDGERRLAHEEYVRVLEESNGNREPYELAQRRPASRSPAYHSSAQQQQRARVDDDDSRGRFGAVAAASKFDEDLVYEQARRDVLRASASGSHAFGSGGRAHVPQHAQPLAQTASRELRAVQQQSPLRDAPVRNLSLALQNLRARSPPDTRPSALASDQRARAADGWTALRSLLHKAPASAWLQSRLGFSSGLAVRGATLTTPRRQEASAFELELRAWHHPSSREGSGGVGGGSGGPGGAEASVAQVDGLEASLRKLLEQLEVSAGSRSKAIARLFADFPAGARALRTGGIGPIEFEKMLLAVQVQWATAASVRALFERWDFDGSRTLTATELEQMLFRDGVNPRARVTIGRVRQALQARGSSGVQSMQDTIRQFRTFDKDGDRAIDRDEFARGLELCLRATPIWPLAPADLESLFAVFDENGDGRIAFEEFAHTVRAPLSRAREDLVLAAYEQLCSIARVDPRGGIVLADIAAQFDGARHPRVRDGQATEGQVLRAYLSGFDKNEDELVSVEEFVDYYTWLGWSIRDDRLFEQMVVDSLRLAQ